MLVLTGDLDTEVVATTPGRREQFRAWCRGASLDRNLAGGVPPEASVLLALRASRLVKPSMRRALARSLRRLTAEATRPIPGGHTAHPTTMHPTTRRRVRENAAALSALAERLELPGPVSSLGVAKVCVLLSDGGGPLHGLGNAHGLALLLREALDTLDD